MSKNVLPNNPTQNITDVLDRGEDSGFQNRLRRFVMSPKSELLNT